MFLFLFLFPYFFPSLVISIYFFLFVFLLKIPSGSFPYHPSLNTSSWDFFGGLNYLNFLVTKIYIFLRCPSLHLSDHSRSVFVSKCLFSYFKSPSSRLRYLSPQRRRPAVNLTAMHGYLPLLRPHR